MQKKTQLTLGMLAATIILAGCAPHLAGTNVPQATAAAPVIGNGQVDFQSSNGGTVKLTMALQNPAQGRRIMAFQQDVTRFEVLLFKQLPDSSWSQLSANPYPVTADGNGNGLLTLMRLEPGHYKITVKAFDEFNTLLNDNATNDETAFDVQTNELTEAPITIKLKETPFLMPGGGLEGQIHTQDGDELAKSQYDNKQTKSSKISQNVTVENTVMVGAIDDEDSFTLALPTPSEHFRAFTTDRNGDGIGNYDAVVFGTPVTFGPGSNPNNGTKCTVTLTPADHTKPTLAFELYRNTSSQLIGMSGIHVASAAPTAFKVDPEAVDTNGSTVTWYGSESDQAINATQWFVRGLPRLDGTDDGDLTNFYLRASDNALLGINMPLDPENGHQGLILHIQRRVL